MDPIHPPTFETPEESSAWGRRSDALERDWEQTKADLSGQVAGHELNQGARDTLRQLVGTEGIPNIHTPNSHENEREPPVDLALERAPDLHLAPSADESVDVPLDLTNERSRDQRRDAPGNTASDVPDEARLEITLAEEWEALQKSLPARSEAEAPCHKQEVTRVLSDLAYFYMVRAGQRTQR